jgi:hypothetical protein
MPRTLDEKNRRARQTNPQKSGIRTGNPQLEPHAGGEARSAPRRHAPRRRVKAKAGAPSGD